MNRTTAQRRYRVASPDVIARIAKANGITDWPCTVFAASVALSGGVTYFWVA